MTTTTGRERMRIAMAGGVPDRVPVMCQLSLGHYFLNTDYDSIDVWHDTETFACALVDLQRRYGFDGILVNMPGRDPDWRRHVVAIEEREDGLRRIRWTDGTFTDQPADDVPHVFVAEGERFAPPLDAIDPERLFYVEPHDISGVSHPYAWGFDAEPAPLGGPEFFPDWQCDTLHRVRELTAGEVSVHAEVFSPFSQMMELVEHTSALAGLLLEEDKVAAILDRLAQGALCLGRLYAEAGCDALLVSSAFVGAGFVSRDHYARFELPYLRRIVTGLHEAFPGLPVYVHTCGAIGDRLDLIEATGVDGIDTFDPPPIGTVTLEDAVRRLDPKVFIKGNLDPIHTLLQGTRAEVRAAAAERLRIAAPRGGYVLSTACAVAPHTPAENIGELRAAVESYHAGA